MKKLIVACLGFLLIATVTYADKPVQTKFSNEESTVLPCDGYFLIGDWTFNTHLTRFFDKDGLLKAVHQHHRADVQFSRDGHPDNVLYGSRTTNQMADFSGGIFTGGVINGGWVMVNLPGYGPLYFDVGHIEVDSSFNITALRGANHDVMLAQRDALCAYFQ